MRKSFVIGGWRIRFVTRRRRKAPSRQGRKAYLQYKEQARTMIRERLVALNQAYGFRYGTVSIKNHKTRWGSCSKKGNLNFSYRLLFLPERDRDYVIVHELCHLKEFNHGPAFWSLVAQAIPDYRAIRKRLRTTVPVAP